MTDEHTYRWYAHSARSLEGIEKALWRIVNVLGMIFALLLSVAVFGLLTSLLEHV